MLVTFCIDSWCRPWGGHCTFTLFGHRMAHPSAIYAMVGSSDMARFGSLEFPALPPVGMWVPPVSKPSQAFHLHSNNGGASSIGSGTPDDFNGEAPALYSEHTLCSNPTVSNVRFVIYSLFTVFR